MSFGNFKCLEFSVGKDFQIKIIIASTHDLLLESNKLVLSIIEFDIIILCLYER